MTATLMPAFDRFPEESRVIGHLLAGYGELEFGLCLCVADARNDFDTTLKAMFRTRGERQRIEIADALGRTEFRSLKLGDMFSEAIADMKFCVQIRNRYAHCTWHDLEDQLGFVELEEIAREHKPALLDDLTRRYLDLPLLAAQERYFQYVAHCLNFLSLEAQKRQGKLRTHAWKAPKKLQRPPAYI